MAKPLLIKKALKNVEMGKPLLIKKDLKNVEYGDYQQQTFNFTRGKGKFDIDKKEVIEVAKGLINAFMNLKDGPDHVDVAISGLTKACYAGLKDFDEPLSVLTDDILIYDYLGGSTSFKVDWSHLSQFNVVVRIFHKTDHGKKK